MSGWIALIKRELRAVLRERTILIAIVIQLFIASFSSALLIGLLSLYDPDSVGVYARLNVGIGFVGAPNHSLIGLMRARGIRVAPFASLNDAQNAFQRGAIGALVVAPPERAAPVEMQVYLPRAEAQSAMILMVLQDPLKRYENVLREQRGIAVRYDDLRGLPPTTFEYLYSIILPALMFFPAFVAGSLVVDSLSEEIEHNTLETLLAAPVSLHAIVGAKIAAAILVAVAQCVAWLTLLRLNRIEIQNFALVLILATIIAGMVAVASAFVAIVFKDRERSQFVYSLMVLVGASASYLFDVSPIKTLTRLAIGDYFTSALNVAVFALTLGALGIVLILGIRRAARA
ncbi:MAG: ABC transporter permease [Chloroflexi bacterium]|nr:ABC transporter permease [Chloroflexota bacterium]